MTTAKKKQARHVEEILCRFNTGLVNGGWKH